MELNSLSEILEDFKNGKCVIVTDHQDRENEGDLVCAGEKVTPEIIAFMANYGRGLICTPISRNYALKFDLPLMVKNNTEAHQTQFTVSIDYKHGTTTGISAYDRFETIKALIRDNVVPDDFSRPGHVFPLISAQNGLKERVGHTEAALFLTEQVSLKPVAVICEIMREDGYMARGNDLIVFAEQHQLKMISIDKLIK